MKIIKLFSYLSIVFVTSVLLFGCASDSSSSGASGPAIIVETESAETIESHSAWEGDTESQISASETAEEPAPMESQSDIPKQNNKNVMYTDANGGRPKDGAADRTAFAVSSEHLCTNTPLGQQLFERKGYQPLCWNTKPDGTGVDIPFGSRTESVEGTVLYMRWVPETHADAFVWEVRNDGVYITGFGFSQTGESSRGENSLQIDESDIWLVIPDELGGLPVTGIAAEAFAESKILMLVLPPTLKEIEPGAFRESTLQEIWRV